MRTQRKGDSSGESTVLAPMPAFTEDGSVDDSAPVFDVDDPTAEPTVRGKDRKDRKPERQERADANHTHTMKKPQRTTLSSTADVSVIEAKELNPAPSDGNFGFDIARTNATDGDDGIMFDEGYSPATEVLRLAFSDADQDSVTPSAPAREGNEPPVAVLKWRTGGGERPPLPPDAGPLPVQAGTPAAAAAASASASASASVPASAAASAAAPGTRIDVVAPSGGIGGGGAGRAPVDVDELRRTLEEAEKLLRTVKHQASSLDLDLVAPGARGMNAQLAAALHRLGEALAMLGK